MQKHNLILNVSGLKKHFPIKRGLFCKTVGHVRAVDDISFDIRRGETLGLVGESGCGKSTTGRCLLRAYHPTAGSAIFRNADGESVDLFALEGKELLPYRHQIRLIFQDPYSSLNPRMTIGDIIGAPLQAAGLTNKSELDDRVTDVLRRVGLRPEIIRRYPHAFSGGERQRVCIARALVVNPRLIVADEAVSALDVSVRAQILNLLQDLQANLDLTYLFIAHDLSVVAYICDRVAVMYAGKLVELTDTHSLFAQPGHPYTEALLSAVPIADPNMRGSKERIKLHGSVPDTAHLPSGCAFHPRCRYAKSVCSQKTPPMKPLKSGNAVACHFAEELTLKGVDPSGKNLTVEFNEPTNRYK